MQFAIRINGSDLSENVRLEDCTIRYELNGRIGTAEFTLLVDQAIGARYGFAQYGQGNYSTAGDLANLDTVEIAVAGSSPEEVLFNGYATEIKYRHRSPLVDEWEFRCQDRTLLLDTVVVNDTWSDKTDQYIIQDAFGALPAIDTSNVASTATLAKFGAKDLTLRQLLDRICSITGAVYVLRPNDDLYYAAEHFGAADFGISDTPNQSSTFEYQLEEYSKDYAGVANRVTCLGALDPDDGSELSVTVNDTDHQAEHGILSITLVDRSILDSAVLTLMANMELAWRTVPRELGEAIVWEDGLLVGQSLSVTSAAFSIAGAYTIQDLEVTKETESRAAYRFRFGELRPDLTRRLREFNLAKNDAKVHQAIPPDGTVGDSKLDRTADPIQIQNADIVSMEFSKVTNVSIQNSDIVSVDFSKVTNVSIQNSDIVSVDFSKVTNVSVQNSQIVSLEFSKVTNVSIDGADIQNLTITGSKIANLAIDNTKISALEVSKISGWGGATLSIGATALTLDGLVDITSTLQVQGTLYGGGPIWGLQQVIANDYVQANDGFRVGLYTVIGSDRKANFVEADCGAYRYSGTLGVGLSGQKFLTDLRDNAGTVEYKSRTMTFSGGLLTSAGTESGWTAI